MQHVVAIRVELQGEFKIYPHTKKPQPEIHSPKGTSQIVRHSRQRRSQSLVSRSPSVGLDRLNAEQ
jgi:hypothetical protein